MKKVLVVVYSLSGGGAEKQARLFLKHFDRKKFIVKTAVVNLKKGLFLPEDVEIFALRKKLPKVFSYFLISLRIVEITRKFKPDVIFSFMWPMNIFSIFWGVLLAVPTVASERTIPSQNLREWSLPFLWKTFIRFFYLRAKKLASVSEGAREDLVKNFGIPEEKIEVIRNGIDIEESLKKTQEFIPPYKNYVLACGNLRYEKNYEFLIKTLAGFEKPVVILGEGKEKQKLMTCAEKYGVQLFLPGFVENPFPWYKNAGVFVITSKYEGFPNSVLEAMVCGAPVVAFDCPGGIREIISDGETGFLARDEISFRKAVEKLFSDENLKKEITENAFAKVQEFSISKTVEGISGILLSV